jgi:hypothetical protein
VLCEVTKRALHRLWLEGGSGLTPERSPKKLPKKPREPRDRDRALQVYVTAQERAVLQANAKRAGMRMSNYLRTAGAGTPLRSVLDLEAIAALAKVSADQGRLGGLLKMYLMDRAPDRRVAERLLGEIEEVQEELRAAARRVQTG